MYSAFKNGIRGLSVVVGAPTCPTKFDDDASEVEDFVKALEAHLTTKKGSPKKWWSTEVIKLLLELHIDYSKDFGIGSQGVAFLEEKKADQKSKYERDQKNCEDILAKKRAVSSWRQLRIERSLPSSPFGWLTALKRLPSMPLHLLIFPKSWMKNSRHIKPKLLLQFRTCWVIF
jgi:hypothetical protein